MLNINSASVCLPHLQMFSGWTWNVGCPGEGAGNVSGKGSFLRNPGQGGVRGDGRGIGKVFLELALCLHFPEVTWEVS